MSSQKQTYVTTYTTDVDPRTLPDYDPDNYEYVPQAARQGSEPASSITTDGHRQRKKYVTTTVTTVTTTTILLPRMQEALVMPSTTEHSMDRRQVGDRLGQVPPALPPPPPPQASTHNSPYQKPQGTPDARPSQPSYPPSSHRQISASDSRREDSTRHLFAPDAASARPHLPEGPGQNPYHSLPLRIDSRGPSSVQSSAKKAPPASAPVVARDASALPAPPRSPNPDVNTNGSRAMNYYQPDAPRGTSAAQYPHQGDHAAGPLVASRDMQLNPDGTVSKPWVFNQNNTKAVTTTATYDRAPTLEELGITSYFANQAPARRTAPYVAGNGAGGPQQPWIVDETREELEGGNAYRYR